MRRFLLPVLATILFVSFCVVGFSQETITITTYYPAPYGVYRDLEVTGGLLANSIAASFQINAPQYWDDYITVETGYGDIIGIGGDNQGNEAEIRLRAPAGREVVAFRDTAGNLIDIRANNVGIPCIIQTFGPGTGNVPCPANFHIPVPVAFPQGTSGDYLCCRYQ